MSFTIDPTVPPNSENPQNGATRIRNLTAELLQVLGFTGTVAETIASPAGAQIDTNTGLFLISAPAGAQKLTVDPNAVAPTTTLDVAAQIVYMLNPTTFTLVRTTSFSASCVVVGAQAGSQANGRDQAGAFGANQFFHLYAIGGGGQTPATLASLVAPLTGPTLPASYTNWAYLGTYLTDGSSNLLPMYGRGNTIYYRANQSLLAGGTATSSTNVPISAFVPSTATQYELFVSGGASAFGSAGEVFEYIGLVSGALNASTSFYQIKFSLTSTQGAVATWLEMPYISGGYYYKLDPQATGATLKTSHQIQGYRVANGST